MLTSRRDQPLKLARMHFKRLDRAGLSDKSVCSHSLIVTIDCSEASPQDLIPDQGYFSLLGGLRAGHDCILRMGFVSRYLECLLTTSEQKDREFGVQLCPRAHIVSTWRDGRTCNDNPDCPTGVLIHSVYIVIIRGLLLPGQNMHLKTAMDHRGDRHGCNRESMRRLQLLQNANDSHAIYLQNVWQAFEIILGCK